MTMSAGIGVVEKTQQKFYEETQIEWRIDYFVRVAERSESKPVVSPCFSAGNDSSFSIRILYQLIPGFMSLYLARRGSRGYAVEYKFGFKRSDGSVLNFAPGILQGSDSGSAETKTILLSDLVSRKSELLPLNALTITCTLNLEVTHPLQPIAVNDTKPLKLIRLDRLSENFKDLFGDKDTCDTTLKVKDKNYKVHKAVLIARSPVFAAAFKHDTTEKQTGVVIIPDCDPDSFKQFLEYLYSGRLEEISFHDALNLYVTSDKYHVLELKEFCVKCLMQFLTEENACEIAVFADKYDETELFSCVQDFFNKNLSEIFETAEWENLMGRDRRLANKLLKEMSKVRNK